MFDLATIPMDELTLSQREKAVGQVANHYARQNVFEEELRDLADNTQRAYRYNMQTFCSDFLPVIQIERDVNAMLSDPAEWEFITFGIVKAYRKWLIDQGYSIATINHKLSTVRKLAQLAHEAGAVEADEAEAISFVRGPGAKKGKRIDERRDVTRVGTKKAAHVSLSTREAYQLRRNHPDTPQGRRDRVLCCLALDHGLRASELAGLEITDINMKRQRIRIYRQKTDLEQLDRLQPESYDALLAYIEAGDAPAMGPLLRRSFKGGRLGDAGMTPTRISARVKDLAKKILGRDDISAHDLRATFATECARAGTDVFGIRDGGGWKTTTMVEKYVKAAGMGKTANERVKLPAPPPSLNDDEA